MSTSKKDNVHAALPAAAPIIWFDGEYVPLNQATVPITTHSLHYGTAIFEGIRFYKTSSGPAVFRLPDHSQRFFYSADVLGMDIPYPEDELEQAILSLIKKNELSDGYIRTIAFFGEGISLVRDDLKVRVAIILLPWPTHQGKAPVRLGLSRFIKPDPRSIIHEAKIAGHYVNSYLAATSVDQSAYGGALMLDGEGNVAETPVANIFGVKDNIVFTPRPGSILPGITRNTVLQFARLFGLSANERVVPLSELQQADEVFITGTAVEVTPIGAIEGARIGDGAIRRITVQLAQAYKDCVQGRNPKFEHWLTRV